MPNGLEIYSNLYPSLDGIGALADAASVSIKTDNSDADVKTLFKGFAGTTPSPLTRSGSVSLFDPVSGSIYAELKARERARKVNVLSLTTESGETEQIMCYIRNVSKASGVGDTAKIDFEIMGKDV